MLSGSSCLAIVPIHQDLLAAKRELIELFGMNQSLTGNAYSIVNMQILVLHIGEQSGIQRSLRVGIDWNKKAGGVQKSIG